MVETSKGVGGLLDGQRTHRERLAPDDLALLSDRTKVGGRGGDQERSDHSPAGACAGSRCLVTSLVTSLRSCR